MNIKVFRLSLISAVTILVSVSVSFAASAVIMNGEAHVGELAVLSVETSQIPTGGSVEWSVSPTTG